MFHDGQLPEGRNVQRPQKRHDYPDLVKLLGFEMPEAEMVSVGQEQEMSHGQWRQVGQKPKARDGCDFTAGWMPPVRRREGALTPGTQVVAQLGTYAV
jgi:hypothetical protein